MAGGEIHFAVRYATIGNPCASHVGKFFINMTARKFMMVISFHARDRSLGGPSKIHVELGSAAGILNIYLIPYAALRKLYVPGLTPPDLEGSLA